MTGSSYHPLWRQISGAWVSEHANPGTVAACLETPWNTPHSTTAGYLDIGAKLGRAVTDSLRFRESPGSVSNESAGHAVPAAAHLSNVGAQPDPVRYGRDVLPIMSARCFACHGPDEEGRQADLRLDLEADAKAHRDSGPVIVPGKPDESQLIARVTSSDADLVMPP